MKITKIPKTKLINICHTNNNHFNTHNIYNEIYHNNLNRNTYNNRSQYNNFCISGNSYRSSFDLFKHVNANAEVDQKTKKIIHNIMNTPSPILLTQKRKVASKIKEVPTFNITTLPKNSFVSYVDIKKPIPLNNIETNKIELRKYSIMSEGNETIGGSIKATSGKIKYLPKLNYYSPFALSKQYQHIQLKRENDSQLLNFYSSNASSSTNNDVVNNTNIHTIINNNKNINLTQTQEKKQIKLKITKNKDNKSIYIKSKNNINISFNIPKPTKSYCTKTPKGIKSKKLSNKIKINLSQNKAKEIITIPNKERLPPSIITNHYSKTFYSNIDNHDTTSLHFEIECILGMPSFSIHGICQGNNPSNAFVIASTVKTTLIDTLSNQHTYKVGPNSTPDDIIQAFISKDYKIMKDIFKDLEDKIRTSMNLDFQKEISYSVGLIIVIGKDLFYVNYGYSIIICNIRKTLKKGIEYLNSETIFNDENKVKGKLTIERRNYDKEIQYMIIINEEPDRKGKVKNILRIIVDDKKKYFHKSLKKDMFYTLDEKMNIIRKYLQKCEMNNKDSTKRNHEHNQEIHDKKDNMQNEDVNFSIVVIQY